MNIKVCGNKIAIELSVGEVPKLPTVIPIDELPAAVERVMGHRLHIPVRDVIAVVAREQCSIVLNVPAKSVLWIGNQKVALPTEWRISPDALGPGPFVCIVVLSSEKSASWVQILQPTKVQEWEKSGSYQRVASANRCYVYVVQSANMGSG